MVFRGLIAVFDASGSDASVCVGRVHPSRLGYGDVIEVEQVASAGGAGGSVGADDSQLNCVSGSSIHCQPALAAVDGGGDVGMPYSAENRAGVVASAGAGAGGPDEEERSAIIERLILLTALELLRDIQFLPPVVVKHSAKSTFSHAFV